MGLKSVRCVRYSAAGALAARARRMMEENGGWGKGGRLLFLFAWTRIEGKGCCLGDESSCCKGLGDNDKEVLTQNLALRRAERILMRWKRCCWQYV